MGTKMKHAPVYFTIAQIRFNTVWTLDSYAPAIQESMRKSGFPDAKKGFLATFNLTPVSLPSGTLEGGQKQVPVAQTTRYEFNNMEGTSGFTLDQGAISFQTTDYDKFETFSGMLLKGLEIVHGAVGLSYYERIGVRYLDAIFPKEGESVKSYLDGSVVGLAEKIEGQLVYSFSETVTDTPACRVVSRALIQHGPLGFPPDLQPGPLKVPKRFENLSGTHAILDNDGFYEQRETFDVDKLRTRLLSIQKETSKSFRAAVSSYALSVWE
ncbi:MAG: TIGR04255 family protein [Noviherbaspirillum sp.]